MMFRNVLTGVVLTAMLSLMLGNTNAEARHYRRQCQNSWGQNSNYGYNQNGYSQGFNGGYGYSNGGYSNAGYGGYGHRGYSTIGIGIGGGGYGNRGYGYGNRSYGGLGFYSGY
jgi:hypothetical protein